MHSSVALRLLNGSRMLYARSRITTASRLFEHISCNKLATSVSISQSTKEKETFQDVLPCIIDTLVTSPKFEEIPDVAIWIKKILDYNLAGGKKNRGLSTVFAYEMLEKPNNTTDDNMTMARTLGWCVEMLQAYFLVADDMMDGSSTRRGRPCWYKLPEVGLCAINDSILIYTSIFEILRSYFGHLPQYPKIVELFNETVLFTSSGQHLDLSMAHRVKTDYTLFTIQRYEAIVKYKTAYYTYRLPVGLGMLLANITDRHSFEKAQNICFEIGKLFQMQDDFIDCYSDESVSGKAGTDIQEGKCSWLAVTALQRCTPAQRAIFEQSYGNHNPDDVQRIKQLYEQLQLPNIYKQIEHSTYQSIQDKITNLSGTQLSPKLFTKLIDMIYNRKQ